MISPPYMLLFGMLDKLVGSWTVHASSDILYSDCKGFDDLGKRCAKYYEQGARFAKWRAVLKISDTAPSLLVCCHSFVARLPVANPDMIINSEVVCHACRLSMKMHMGWHAMPASAKRTVLCPLWSLRS